MIYCLELLWGLEERVYFPLANHAVGQYLCVSVGFFA
ncbi:hypothetical protein CA85_22840 [Allorhodopirellula solitaria]|uniref:Uncharacterized protein n=1 Tax=Allorhodopirellula solitaria TaxID=2527987 RepID=A0A5C5XYR9_9BACT|nr:hypothetical protein CA85_22840 [Allorhodopirellula solitaria]